MKLNEIFKKYLPSLGKSWLIVLVFFAGAIIMNFLVMNIPEDSFWRNTLMMYIYEFIPVGLYVFLDASYNAKPFVKGLSINHASYGKMSPFLFYPMILICILAIQAFTEPLTSLIPMPPVIKDLMAKMVNEMYKPSAFPYTVICVVLVGPFVEEFLCRGLILRGLLSRMTPWKAIAWSALIFSVLHGNPYQGVPAFIVGCFLGWVYYKTHSLWATILLHSFNNLASVIMSSRMSDLPIDAGFKDMPFFSGPNTYRYYIFVALSVVITALFIWILQRNLSKENTFLINNKSNKDGIEKTAVSA